MMPSTRPWRPAIRWPSTLKEARALRTRYGQLFEPQTYDGDAGRVMQKIVNTDATPNEVVNLLFGYGERADAGFGARRQAHARHPGRYVSGVGQYREAAFMRLIGGPSGAGRQEMIISRINRALDGQGCRRRARYSPGGDHAHQGAARTAIERTVTP